MVHDSQRMDPIGYACGSMCGVVALWGDASLAAAERMIEVLAHRGPDGVMVRAARSAACVLAHRRLAIIDPAGGMQPLGTADGDWLLVANGMIYNDLELRARFGSDRYLTGSDCESILGAIVDEGPAGISRLDGMFAFVATDGRRLIAGRDHIGIKPLYYAERDGVLAFASEIKALQGFSATIVEFPPGYVFDSEEGFRRYYDIEKIIPKKIDLPEAIDGLRHRIESAVRKQLRSDVPLGVFLSGGIDSSVIAAVASQLSGVVKTFAVGVAGSADLRAARRVADHIGSTHHELVLTGEMIERGLPKILYHLESFDQGLVRSAVPCFWVSELAAGEVKVALTGEGADELFAGYGYYAEIEDDEELDGELRASIGKMHNMNLQRVDRMSMAHGLEARVPFLDREVLEFALSVPVSVKVNRQGAEPMGKWLLRKAFEDLLPPEIAWRTKVQFDQGSGVSPLLSSLHGDGADLIVCRDPALGRTREERHYREVLSSQFTDPNALLDLVAHWHPEFV